jgi:hypothetical protein
LNQKNDLDLKKASVPVRVTLLLTMIELPKQIGEPITMSKLQ